MSHSHVSEGFSKLVYFHILSAEGSFLFESDEVHDKSAYQEILFFLTSKARSNIPVFYGTGFYSYALYLPPKLHFVTLLHFLSAVKA